MTDTTIAELRELLAKATAGPYDHMEGMGIVRALRGDVAIPLFETRTPWHDPQHGAPTVRLAGRVIFRANSEGAKTSEALGREWNNAALVAAALNALPALLDRVEVGEDILQRLHDYDSWGGKGFHGGHALAAKNDGIRFLQQHSPANKEPSHE
ncbi:MAG: hypothetical protein V4523_08095 [Pseudomonadota bacterium]